MDAPEEWETTDIVICGCGPTGAMLSAYLGRMSVTNIVLEKESDITTDPRGIALDEEGIRLVQGLGIYDHIYKTIGTCMYQFKFVGGKRTDLNTEPFMRMDYATTEGGTGHVGFICHKQPELEKYLRAAMHATQYSQLRPSSTVTKISEDENWVYCHYLSANGKARRVRSKFLVGADGKTGFTRKHYLEAKGVRMEKVHNTTYEETWVALNWRISLPTETTHPDFPLWRLGYSPGDVYNQFFPNNFRFLCNPNRAAVCGRFGLPSDRLWRFEFVVLKGENGSEMSTSPMIKKVVFPYLKHSGIRYGLPHDVQFPEDCIEVLRCRPFTFSARSCNKWAHGRVILCGDSAHVFPPFGGQGIASGFRDAVSLAWRLSVACQIQVPDNDKIEKLFVGWYLERKQQLEQSLASTIENGNFVTESNAVKIFFRDWYLWLVQLVPSWRHSLHLGNRREGMVRYEYCPGLPFMPELGGGICFPQVYCRSIDPEKDEIFFTDDLIWNKHKRGLFGLVVLIQKLDDLEPSLTTLKDIDKSSDGKIHLDSITIILENLAPVLKDHIVDNKTKGHVYQIASAKEFSKSPLCHGRPEPQGYDAHRLGKEVKKKRYIFLRPDRFVFAACDSEEELDKAIAQIAGLLQGCVAPSPIKD